MSENKKKPNKPKKSHKSKKISKPHGHYCHVCGEHKANEKFSGKGHATHICKVCHALPLAQRNELENMRKIDHIQENFFISKENLKRLKKYANDGRYAESSKYAKEALEGFYMRMDEYHGRNIETGIKDPVLYSELDDAMKIKAQDYLEDSIYDFIEYAGYIPENGELREIIAEVCAEISEELNVYEPELFDPVKQYSSFHIDVNDEENDNDDELDEFGMSHEDMPTEVLEKELLPDDLMNEVAFAILNKTLEKLRNDGYCPPTFLETLVVIETDRLILRRFIPHDYRELYDTMKNPEVMYAWERGFKKGEVKKWINTQMKRYRDDGYGYFAVVLKDGNKLIGQTGLVKSNINGEDGVEIGYIFDNEYWGNGYAFESASACIKLAFAEFEIKKLFCTTRPENQSSVKLAQRLGMNLIGEYMKFFEEKEMPHIIFTLQSNESDL